MSWSIIYRPALYADFDSFQAPPLPVQCPQELWECATPCKADGLGGRLPSLLGRLFPAP